MFGNGIIFETTMRKLRFGLACLAAFLVAIMANIGPVSAQPYGPYPGPGYYSPPDVYAPRYAYPGYVVEPPGRYFRRRGFVGPPPEAFYEPPVAGWAPPPRPTSCGRYRYWNGEYCADARYERPYLGPKY